MLVDLCVCVCFVLIASFELVLCFFCFGYFSDFSIFVCSSCPQRFRRSDNTFGRTHTTHLNAQHTTRLDAHNTFGPHMSSFFLFFPFFHCWNFGICNCNQNSNLDCSCNLDCNCSCIFNFWIVLGRKFFFLIFNFQFSNLVSDGISQLQLQ